MNTDRKRRPTLASAALAVSVLALVVALTGVAAGLPGKGSVDRNDIKANAVKSKNVAPDSLNGTDIAPDALNGADIAEASLGEVPTAGAPFAYARVVDPAGTAVGVDEALSQGITDAMVGDDNGAQSGKTCFDLPFAVRGAQVTMDYAQAPDESSERTAAFALGDPFSNCNAPFKDAVVSVHADTGPGADMGFYIAFYR